jgi:hypothetical protein
MTLTLNFFADICYNLRHATCDMRHATCDMLFLNLSFRVSFLPLLTKARRKERHVFAIAASAVVSAPVTKTHLKLRKR